MQFVFSYVHRGGVQKTEYIGQTWRLRGLWGMGKELIEEQGVTGLPRESRQTTAELQTCGKENALLALVWLILPARHQYSVCQPCFYLHSAEFWFFSFSKCQMILKLTCAIFFFSSV